MDETTRLTLRVIALENKLNALPVPDKTNVADMFKKLSALEKEIIVLKNDAKTKLVALERELIDIKNDLHTLKLDTELNNRAIDSMLKKKFSFRDLFK